MKRFQLMQRVNIEGLYGAIQASLPHFKKNSWKGRIIVVSPPIYSRFFRGPVLSSDAEELPDLRVAQQPPRRFSEPNDPNHNVLITEQGKGKKRKSQEEGGEETRLSRKKRKSKKETETKEETKERRRSKKLNREARKGDACEDRLDGRAESGLAKKSTAPEILVQNHDVGGPPRRKDRKKKGKRKDREGSVCHNG